jgi:hypothetical protein
MLKNYTVRIKNVKCEKVSQILKYLNDNEHKNHTKKNTEIFELSNLEEFKKLNQMKIKKNESNYKLNGKGGRKLSISNKSLTFNLPNEYNCSIEQLKEINTLLNSEIIKLYKTYKFDIAIDEIYSVIHYQDNAHIHTLLPYLDNNGEVIRAIKSKNFLTELKLRFTISVDKILGTDFKAYKPLNKEQKEHNRVVAYLEELKAFYTHYLSLEDSKYYKNQIINIERVLKDNPKELNHDIETIIKNSEKVQELRIKTNMKTTKLPTI